MIGTFDGLYQYFFDSFTRQLSLAINNYSWCFIWNLAVLAVLDWIFVQRLVVLNSVVDKIFDTIIITLIDFVLWEILMFLDTIRISKKSFSCALLFLLLLFFNVTKPFFVISKTVYGPNNLKVNLPLFLSSCLLFFSNTSVLM